MKKNVARIFGYCGHFARKRVSMESVYDHTEDVDFYEEQSILTLERGQYIIGRMLCRCNDSSNASNKNT